MDRLTSLWSVSTVNDLDNSLNNDIIDNFGLQYVAQFTLNRPESADLKLTSLLLIYYAAMLISS